MTQDASIILLGGFELRLGGARVEVPPVAQRVLAFLALQERPVHRVRIAGAIWCDVPEELAAARLRSTLWRIRRRDAQIVRSSKELLALSAAVWVDAHEVMAATRMLIQDDPASADEVDAALLRGDLLPGWYDDWVLLEQERLRHLRGHALERLALLLAGRERYGEAVEAALELIREEPLRETAHRTLIGIHLMEGNRAEAVRQYRVLEAALARELRVAPSLELRELLGRALLATV